jgi:hypothetical protein
MGIVSLVTDLPGQIGDRPRRPKLLSSDTLTAVTTAGYLNQYNLQGQVIYPTDVIDCWYGYVSASNPGTNITLVPSIANGVVSLLAQVSPGNVLLPVVSGDLAVFNGTTGQVADSSILATNLVVKNAVNTMAAGSSIVLAKVNGTEAANAVTASGVAGLLTTSSLTTAGAGSYAITWTNTFITATSVVLLTIAGGTNTTENITLKVIPGAGSATLTIYNNTAATALNGTILISYAVL